jgi:hypothetical protein
LLPHLLQGQLLFPQLPALLKLPLSDLFLYLLCILTVFERDQLSDYGIQSFIPFHHPITHLTPILTDIIEDVLGHPLVPVVVWSELELDQVNFPQEDVDHSQFFR